MLMRIAAMTNRTFIPVLQWNVTDNTMQIGASLETHRVIHRFGGAMARLAKVLRVASFA